MYSCLKERHKHLRDMLNYWQKLRISDRFLSLILLRLNLAHCCVLCLLMPNPFLSVLPISLWLTKQPPLCLPQNKMDPRDAISKTHRKPKMIKQKGSHTQTHLADYSLVFLGWTYKMCYFFKLLKRRWESKIELLTYWGKVIKYGLSQTSIVSSSTDRSEI